MGEAYPELAAERETIARWVGDEEESFGRTLERGTELLERLVAEAKEAETSWIDAADAFKLHDTYGFPYDLTKELLAEQGLSVDDGGFEELMEEQRQRARVGAATAHGSEDRHERVIAFAGAAPPTRFVGYETLRATTGLAAVERDDGRALVKLEESPFYAEGGGQVADSGVLRWQGGEAKVVDVYRVGEDQALEVEPSRRDRPSAIAVEAEVDRETRHATMRNHTATHLLHAALRERLGTHVRQAGSAVRPDKLRFDFTHGQALGAEELRAVEDRVNEWIKASRPVRWLEMERAEAERLGAMALFGEKYGEWVRVVEVDGVSRELCGGTHVANTAEVGIFKIASEGSSAANVRRIEALTGPAAIDWFREREERLREVGELLGTPQDPLAGARRAAERLREAGKGAQQAQKQLLGEEAERLVGEATEVGGIKLVASRAPLADQKQLLDLANRVQSKLGGDSASSSAAPRAARSRSSSSSPRGRSSAGSRRPRSSARRRRSSAAAAVAATTWPRPAARTRRSSTRRWRRRERRSSGRPGRPMRVLALDHGTARIGCAISDPSGTLATPLPVIEPPEARSVAELVAEYEVERVVVGLPASPQRRGGQPGGPGAHLLRRTGSDPRRSGRDLRRAADDPHGRGEQARRGRRRARLARRRASAAGLPRRPGRDRGARR